MPRRARLVLSVVVLLTMSNAFDAAAEQPQPAPVPTAKLEPIRYTLRFPAPQTHYVEVTAEVPAGRAAIDLEMAVWTPGSYLVREFSRNVERVEAQEGGQARAVEKIAKNRWRVQADGAPSVTVRYRVYGREMTVRTNFVDADFALLNGAATYLTLAGDTGPREHEVQIELPAAWKTSVSALPEIGEGSHRYRAADYDTLVDSPIVAGNPSIYDFTVGGIRHTLVNVGEGGVWDGPRSAADAQRIVEAEVAFWGQIPYERYVFFNILSERSGGLEHKNSCTLMASRWQTRTRRGYVDWLTLVAHEFFHAWNVKRLRPVELGPFNYQEENYTRMLWVAEGLTSYYGDLLAARAGVITREEYFAELGGTISDLQSTPGRLSIPVEDASLDAWIRYYRPDENTPNTNISYYTKGAVIGFLLDLSIRRATENAKSLDDVMRLAYERYSGPHGFTSAQFRALASEVAGQDLGGWLHQALDTTGELNYDAIGWLGLRFRPDNGATVKAWIGLTMGPTLKNESGRLVVAQVRRGTPAFEAGVNVDDEILGVGGYRVRADQWDARLEAFRPGDRVDLLVARRERLTTLPITFAAAPRPLRLEADPAAPVDAQARLNAWLHA